LLNSGSYIVAGFLYQKYPGLTPYQLVFVRSAFSIFYLAFMINKDAKKIFYTKMERKYLGPLVFRSIQSTVSSLINMVAVLHIEIVIVSLVNNTTPVFVCLLAMCFLKEKLKVAEVFFMALTFGAVIMIIVG
jgi:drug/metabolite transporter (DMT)-like permease